MHIDAAYHVTHCLRWSIILTKGPFITNKPQKKSKSIKNKATPPWISLWLLVLSANSMNLMWRWKEVGWRHCWTSLMRIATKSRSPDCKWSQSTPELFEFDIFPLCCRWIGRLSPPPGSQFLPRRSNFQVNKPTLVKYNNNNVDGKKDQSRHLSRRRSTFGWIFFSWFLWR